MVQAISADVIQQLRPLDEIPFPPIERLTGLSPLSSLKKSEKDQTAPIHSPVLPQPKTNIGYDVLALQRKVEELAELSTEAFRKDADADLAEMERLSAEKQKALENQARAASTKDTWSRLAQVGQYVSAAASIAAGAALGGVPGVLLGISGAVGIVSRVVIDNNLSQACVSWLTKSAEMQKNYAQKLEVGLFFLQMGLGLAGGLSAWKSGAFAAERATSALDWVKRGSTTVATASSIMGATARVGSAYYTKKLYNHRAEMTQINCEMTTARHELAANTQKIQSTITAADEMAKQIQELIANQRVEG